MPDLTLPNGNILRNVDKSITKKQAAIFAIKQGLATIEDFKDYGFTNESLGIGASPAKRAEAQTATQKYDEERRSLGETMSGFRETLRGTPDIPKAEDPTKVQVPFAPPPSQQVGGGGDLGALGDYAPGLEKALSSAQASPSLDGQRLSDSPTQDAQGGKMPFQGLAKEPRKPEFLATQAVEKGREGKKQKNWWEPMPDAERKILEDRLKSYSIIRDFSPGVVAEKNEIIKKLKKDDELRNHPEKYNPNHPDYAFLASKELKQELWPDYDVRRLDGQIPKAFPTSPDDILAGYKKSSIDSSVLENPSIWQQLGLVPLSPQSKSAIQESLFENARSTGGFMSSPTGLGSIEMGSAQTPKRILSGEERQKAKNALELDEAVRKGLPTLVLDGNPTASLVHHNRVIAKKANEFYDGDVSRYMDITESRNIIPNYLSELDQQENKILSDIRSMESVWKTQVAAGNNDIAAETFKAIAKKKDEYTKLVAQKQLDVTNEIRALSQSDDPKAKRKIEVLRAQNQLFMMTDEEREKFALKKAVPNVDQLRETVFKGMSDRDILRLALHTKYLQLQKILPDNALTRGADVLGVDGIFDEDVRRLKQEIAILAPVVFLNKTPIKKIDEGFFSTAGKSFGAGFGGEGSERTRASRLSQVLQDYGVMQGASPEAITGIESAQAVENWSREEAGELVGTSGEFMVKLIPTAILTEMGLGAVGVASQVKRGADVLKLIGRAANSRKALYAGRALEGTYEAVKQGLSYELGGRLYDQESEMDFLSGALGGVGGFVVGGAASKLAEGVEKRILATFGNASEDVVSKMIELGKKASASGVRSIGQGIGETAEEFGEALGGIIDKSDSAAEIMKNLREQFPDASSIFHFAAQSFLMGSIMSQSSTIGAALYKRAGNYYSQLSRGEKDKIDQLIREIDEVGAEVEKEVERPKEEITSIEERLNKVQTRIAQIESGNRIVGKGGVTLNFPDELAVLRAEEDQLVQKHKQLKQQQDAASVSDASTKLETEAKKAEIEDKRSEELERVNIAVAEASETGTSPELDGRTINPEQEISSINAKYDAEIAALTQTTADAVQERTTAEVGAQPVGTEGAGQEGRGGVGPGVQGPEAPQAGGAQGQVTPTTEPTAKGPVRPEAPPAPSIQEVDAEPAKYGYHGGTLSEKSDYLRIGYRGEQPFTGYYFTSNRGAAEQRGDRLGPKDNKQARAVDFSKYNLLRPTTNGYWAIKSGLKKIERAARNNDEDAIEFNINDIASFDANLGQQLSESKSNILDWYKEWDAQKEANFEKGDYAKSATERFETFVLKKLGYEGIDVRGLKEQGGEASPDTESEGSVIFDIKPGTVVDITPGAEPAAPSPTTAPAAAPAPTTAPTPNKETVAKMKELDKIEEKMSSGAKKLNAPAKEAFDKMVAADPRIDQVKRANFDKAVADLEKSGKLKVRCP